MSVLIDIIKKAIGKKEDEVSERTLAGHHVFGTPAVLRQSPDYDDGWLYALAKHHARIMDVGANRGFTALLASVAGDPKTRRLLLVDANPAALGVACQNLCMNGFGKGVVFHRGLVSDEVGKDMDFFTVGAGDAGSIYASHAKSAARQEQSYRLKSTTIDAIAAEHDFVPDLVKMDVEGAELDALRGAVEVARSNAVFFIEMHALDNRPMVESARQVIEWAKANGRTPYYMKHHQELTSPEMIADRGRCHLLILKDNQEYPEYLKSIPQGSPIPD